MIHKLLSVYDVKSEAYSKPVAVPAVGAGIRAFADAINEGSTDYAKHPEDYDMYEMGDFDDVSGVILPLAKPKFLAKASSLKDVAK